MIKDFNTFIGESLEIGTFGGIKSDHFEKRANTRLKELKVVNLVDSSGKSVKASPDELSKVTRFFQNALFHLADPINSTVFEQVDIPFGKIGIIRMGKPVVVLEDGLEVNPVFEVYERTSDSDPKKVVMRQGKCFWIFTTGSVVRTIKLYETDGVSQADRNILVEKSIEHLLNNRGAELARIARALKVDLTDINQLREIHSVILKPVGIDTITLDLSSAESPHQQLSKFISSTSVRQPEKIDIVYQPPTEDIFLEKVPKQMNVTPDRVWVLERNEKFDTWGARPITHSEIIKRAGDTWMFIKVGDKHLHWLDFKEPVFNPPVPNNERVIKKGDTITLAKRLGSGDWLANTGKVKEINIESRTGEPYVRTGGWDNSEIIPRNIAGKIFRKQATNESFFILNFKDWLLESKNF